MTIVAILAGFSSVILVMLLGQSRVFYSMSRDGLRPEDLLRAASEVQDAVQVEHAVLRVHGALRGFVPGNIVGEMTSIGTLFAFMLVCAGVWIMRVPSARSCRGRSGPAVPVVSTLGIMMCGAMIYGRPADMAATGRVAGDRPGVLLRLRQVALEVRNRSGAT